MAARMRAPGLMRAGEFTVLGVLFAAALVTIIRLAYGFSNPFDGADGWDVKFQDAVLVVSLVGAPLFFLVGLSSLHAIARRPAINLAWEWAAVGLVYFLFRNLPRTRGESAVLAGALLATAVAVSVYGLYQVVVELPMMRARYLSHRLEALRLVGITPGSPAQALYESRLLDSNEPWATFALA